MGLPTTLRALLTLGLTAILVACGAGSSTPPAPSHAFDQFPKLTAPTTAQLPAPPRTLAVERTYLVALFEDAQDTWRQAFRSARRRYDTARVVVFAGAIRSECGPHEEGAGPFFCPADHTVYLDTDFFARFLHHNQLDAAAQAYIVGHELAHHVQRLAGVAAWVEAADRADPSRKTARTRHVELQADCLAGVWARSAFPRSGLTTTDLVKGMEAADAIGDDFDARMRGQYLVDTEEWTHGSSAQRQLWLRTGFTSGRASACNTFDYA